MRWTAKWIRPQKDMGDVCPVIRKRIITDHPVREVWLYITALGVYEGRIGGERIGEYVFAPGWTAYEKRLQYQRYNLTEKWKTENEISFILGKGWYSSPMPGWLESEDKERRRKRRTGLLAEIHILYEDGKEEIIGSDQSWEVGESQIRFSELYDGEVYDANFITNSWESVCVFDGPMNILIPQEGEEIREFGVVQARSIFTTEKGEIIVDFGQEITGYTEISLQAQAGKRVKIQYGEVLDQKGNFYRDNYRSAKAEMTYICRDGWQSWHPHLTFFGFRYIKINEFPGEPMQENFRAICVGSDIKQTGYVICGNQELNQLLSNILWGQRDNFLDVPTDCPQRDERLGWTGDAQVFVKAASYNFDVEKFFVKWLHDLAADQRESGAVGQVIPDYLPDDRESTAWGDAAVICPWQIYQTYGDARVLQEQFESMKGWVDYITKNTSQKFLWTGGVHFGDWLGLDAPSGSYCGSSRKDFIASAFYAYSTELLIKSGKIIGRDMSEYEELYRQIVSTFRKAYPVYQTQTEHVLAIQFKLAEDLQKTADLLAKMIVRDGNQIRTGFVGTPYILHTLSRYGYQKLAYTLLLRREYPSWIYSVRKGATTVWEHWDSIKQDGEFWSPDMNSFNHYAYGSVIDWIYEVAAGITHTEENPGFQKAVIEPKADKRLGYLKVSLETRSGKFVSGWSYDDQEKVRYDITTPVSAEIRIKDRTWHVKPGEYVFWENKKST